MENRRDVQLAADIPLSKIQRLQLRTPAERFLLKVGRRFDFANLKLHLKNEGPQVACQLSLVTNEGRYHATVSGWDARTIVQQAVDTLDMQVTKHFSKVAHG